MRVIGLVLVMWLAGWSVTASAMPAGIRPSSATVKAITEALSTPEAALQLLREHDLTISSLLTGKNQTLLHLIAEMPDDSASVRALNYVLDQQGDGESVDLNPPDSDGMRPLHRAVRLGKQQTAERLLGGEAQVNVRDNEGRTPIDYAEQDGNQDLAELLRTYAQAQEGLQEAQEDEDGIPTVPSFLINLNELADEGEIDSLVGRVNETIAVLEALSKRRKNNPLLVGAAGVGKTAIAEGIADLIVRGEAPAEFLDRTIYNINLGTLMAGTGGRGELEERVAELMAFAKNNPDALFFIDEVHLIAAGGATGGVDLASMLKPELESGNLPVIGATTDGEYRRHILSDKALNRRFSVIRVAEPSEEEAIEILLAVRDKLSDHHGVEIRDSALIAAAKYAPVYFNELKLPDSALNLVDEAAAALRFESGKIKLSLADILGKITRRSSSLKWLSNKRKKQVASEITELKDEQDKQSKDLEDHLDSKLSSMQEEIGELEASADSSEQDGEAQEDTGILGKLRKKFQKMMRRKRVEDRHIAELISRKLGIPVETILKTEQETVADLEKLLKQVVFGQDTQLERIASTLTVSYAGLGLEGRTLGAFMMTGNTGTGKTHTAQMLADIMFNGNLERFDMSEYQESHAISTLIGAPPGYVGFDQGGTLTGAILRRPHAVILFDEAEKAHPDFQNILLQILEGARLTDRSGETVDFSNTIVMMTVNSPDLSEDFRPEVLNRIDNILHYGELAPEVMGRLVQAELIKLNARLRTKEVTVAISEEVVAKLSEEGYNPEMGARPLQRIFNRRITKPLAGMLVRGEIEKGTYTINLKDDGGFEFVQTSE